MRAAVGLLVVLAMVPASAQECTPTTSQAELTVGGFYVDRVPPCQTGMLCHSVWVYEETNGHAGLQRGDELIDDTCGGVISADRLAFAMFLP